MATNSNTRTSIRRWNVTVASYVLWQAQEAQKAGTPTGVVRFQQRVINTAKEVGWEVRLTATPEGEAWVLARIQEVLAMPQAPATAAPEWVA